MARKVQNANFRPKISWPENTGAFLADSTFIIIYLYFFKQKNCMYLFIYNFLKQLFYSEIGTLEFFGLKNDLDKSCVFENLFKVFMFMFISSWEMSCLWAYIKSINFIIFLPGVVISFLVSMTHTKLWKVANDSEQLQRKIWNKNSKNHIELQNKTFPN